MRLDTGISLKLMSIINLFANDIFERIAGESSRSAHYNKTTITSREIQTVVLLLLPAVVVFDKVVVLVYKAAADVGVEEEFWVVGSGVRMLRVAWR
ncbi:unnamed protein product [Mesocestoides corti]|uniref:Histone H2A/H2B/H3 domain-containing protein n=1 Tax=Mesocestoides corti TaxID=53468 RepID=A0A0R3UPM1_MESCO|nr:unnamed protein product [Mesocestoides corti]